MKSITSIKVAFVLCVILCMIWIPFIGMDLLDEIKHHLATDPELLKTRSGVIATVIVSIMALFPLLILSLTGIIWLIIRKGEQVSSFNFSRDEHNDTDWESLRPKS